MEIKLNKGKNDIILALGAESAGNFSVFYDGKIFHSDNFGDLLVDKNFKKFQKAVLDFLKKEDLIPNIIITDLHPLYVTTTWGKELSNKFKANHIEVQHHIAHIFSQAVEFKKYKENHWLQATNYKLQTNYGIALDGTGFGLDGNIWGGEIFKIKKDFIRRIGHLEYQTLIGGDLAIREPARLLISVLGKFLNKKGIYTYIKKYYDKNQFELLWNQLQENFNCQETSSTGRVLDAVSVLLGFSKNERKEKHGATYLLEKNSTKPYSDLKPKIKDKILLTTPLFDYLIKNFHKDEKRLAATAQLYVAQGLLGIIGNKKKSQVYISGGLSENKIISDYFKSQGFIKNKKSCAPYGDAGLSLGQIVYYLSNLKNKKYNL